jgi:hypothetical protein
MQRADAERFPTPQFDRTGYCVEAGLYSRDDRARAADIRPMRIHRKRRFRLRGSESALCMAAISIAA